MSRLTPGPTAAAFAALLVAMAALPALGHAPGATIQLSHDQIQPGSTVTVHGQGMNADEEIVFELGDATKAMPLGSAVATGDGSVDAFLEIPWQTPKGAWEIYARGADGDVVSAPIVLAGVALDPQDGEGEPPDEEDPLVGLEPTATADESAAPAATDRADPTTVAAAAPTFRPRTLPPQPLEAPAVGPAGVAPPDPTLWLVAASGGIAVVTLLVLALLLRRRSREATG